MTHDPARPTGTIRAFIAVELPPEAQAALAGPVRRWQADCQAAGLAAQWSRPEGWHLTLKFLGAVPSDRLPAITERLAEAATRHRPFAIQLAGFGAFPTPRRPRVLWIGVADDEGRAGLIALAGGIEAAVAPLGYPAEARPFHPHLTLARIDAGVIHELPLPGQREKRLATIEVNQVALMKSERKAGVSVYTSVAIVGLGV